jgi:hypothetical protein
LKLALHYGILKVKPPARGYLGVLPGTGANQASSKEALLKIKWVAQREG